MSAKYYLMSKSDSSALSSTDRAVASIQNSIEACVDNYLVNNPGPVKIVVTLEVSND